MSSDEGLFKAYSILKQGDVTRAKQVLTGVLEYDLDNKEVKFAVWCCSFWEDYIHQFATQDAYEQGEGLTNHWKQFLFALRKQREPVERTLYAVQTGIFLLALQNFTQLDEDHAPVQKAEVYRKIGLCYKKLGQYDHALEKLIEANALLANNAGILAEMADCYALCGEERNAKVLFREAFFVGATRVDLDFLDSELICCLVRQVQEHGYSGQALQEWVPVYGILYGIFNIRRELRSQEVGHLKQEIFACENELRDPSCDTATTTPRLINMYFWLIDHYVRTENGSEKINEILLRIKILDRNNYDLYVK